MYEMLVMLSALATVQHLHSAASSQTAKCGVALVDVCALARTAKSCISCAVKYSGALAYHGCSTKDLAVVTKVCGQQHNGKSVCGNEDGYTNCDQKHCKGGLCCTHASGQNEHCIACTVTGVCAKCDPAHYHLATNKKMAMHFALEGGQCFPRGS